MIGREAITRINGMKRKVVKVFIFGLLVPLLLLVAVNRFVFSWTGLILKGAGLCKFRSIGVPTENGHNQKLQQKYDLRQIAAVMRANPNYEVNDRASGGIGLVLSRRFNGVKYNISFDVHNDTYEFNLNTYDFDGYPNGSVSDGEKCTTASYRIEQCVYRMIDDLPLNSLQRAELKANVIVENMADLRITF
jgi:hypothetical protein